jgi:AhpD family alkylhydroperoxidase
MTANDLFAAAPELMKKWTATSLAVASSLDPALIPLVEIRASQINGCANCINMHAAEARAKGETEQRIYLLPAWRDAPCYTDRERAALGWTEALTRLSEGHTHESAYDLKAQFTKEEQVKLTLMINVINGWNRISVGFGMIRWMGPIGARCVNPRRSCAGLLHASVLINSSRRDASARPMSARGFPIPSSKRRTRKTSPCR